MRVRRTAMDSISLGGRYALDDLRDPAGAVAARHGVVVHHGWVHPHSAGRRPGDSPDSRHPGPAPGMKPGTIIGLILIVLGVVGFALGGFSFTHKEKVLDVGPIEATADDKDTVPIPPILAGLALVGGVV